MTTCRRHLILSPGAISVVEKTPATIPATNNCPYLQTVKYSGSQPVITNKPAIKNCCHRLDARTTVLAGERPQSWNRPGNQQSPM